ncbi:geopilin [Syntrophotalea carbinolica DSM 2380]|uniref:Geopilin n=1 Tax=Syntrophotalea carbinolica (strain DSM 2380 / NBRC 103641 / GraBd1) TaxID=338963 RepID=Q3A2M5_SYNC1|nr:prepilin-type N-terminal cleavage/methylation domain-containing protein [Syntrophotalea carbinolica]ABA89382.1 geopilin [Syntrophotalea carbinolica DSM 2380]
MSMMCVSSKNNKIGGFSLIELVIVVFILSVLAAVAIPKYRELVARADNGAALADLGQHCKLEAAFMGDFSQYGRTNNAAAAAAHGVGAILIGPADNTMVIACPDGYVRVGLSSGVHFLSNTQAANGSGFSAIFKHVSGTRIYGVDSDTFGIFQIPGVSGQTLLASGANVASTAGDDFSAAGWQHF